MLQELSDRAAVQLEYVREIEASLGAIVDEYAQGEPEGSGDTGAVKDGEFSIIPGGKGEGKGEGMGEGGSQPQTEKQTERQEMALLRKVQMDTLVLREIELDLLQVSVRYIYLEEASLLFL